MQSAQVVTLKSGQQIASSVDSKSPIGDLPATKKFRWSYSTGPRQKQTAAQFLTVVATRMKQEALKFAIRGVQKGVANARSPDQRPHE